VTSGRRPEKDKKKDTKAGGGAATAAAPAATDTLIHKCEFKVGTITKVWNHPEADKLYCEEVDCGEGEVRQIASGLRDFMTLEQMQGARVLVFANLKPRPLKGFTSNGMVLCASAPGKTSVEFVIPPEGVPNGEVVSFEGHALEAGSTNFMAKKKVPEKVLPDLKLSPAGVAMWRDIPFMTSKGPVVAPTLKEAAVG
jgi:aminoacyl tRNA synthase complex-interacting multifunctional protein 1